MCKQRFNSSPEVRKVMQKAIASGEWEYEGSKTHNHLRHKPTGKLVVAARSATCYRSAMNLARDIRHVEAGLPGFGMPNELPANAKLDNKNKKVATA